MFKFLATFALLSLMVGCKPHASQQAADTTINSSMTTGEIQAALNGAAPGSTVTFVAGNYSITAPLTVPCNNLQLAGPIASQPTAILNATYTNNPILMYGSNCAALGAIRYLGFANTGAVYFGVGSNSNFTFEHNTVSKLPSNLSNTSSESGLFFDGNLTTKLSNILVQYNTFGDAQSCTAVFGTAVDMGGHCAGILVSAGESNGITIQRNSFEHLEEGVHFFQLQGWSPGANNSVCVACTVSLNTFAHYHRIAVEIQVSTPTDSIMVEHNAIVDPLNSSYGTFALSMACCQWGYKMAAEGHSPGYVLNDNVIIASQPCGAKCPPIGVEFWGTGSQGLASLVEGSFSNGYTWGYGGGSWAINRNYICGPMQDGGYITDQQHQGQSAAPAQSSNSTGAVCQAKASSPPSLTPSSSGSMTIAMADPGPNTSIWYTLDGSTPVPGTAKLYTAPVPITSTTTIKALGMWGTGTQPKSYPAGYGYTPSAVVSATYTPGTPPPANCTVITLNPNGTYKSAVVPCVTR